MGGEVHACGLAYCAHVRCDRTSGGAKFFPSTVKIIIVTRLARTRAQRLVSACAQLFFVFQVGVLSGPAFLKGPLVENSVCT